MLPYFNQNDEYDSNFDLDDYYDGSGGGSIDIPKNYRIDIEIEGSADSISLSYTLDDSSRSYDYATLPWSRTIHFAEEGEYYSATAQNNGEYGSVKATLKIDGQVVQTDESYSAYGVVSVGGYL